MLLALSFSACKGDNEPVSPDQEEWTRPDMPTSSSSTKAYEAVREFSFDMFRQLWNDSDGTDNLVFSPISLYSSLSMYAVNLRSDRDKLSEMLNANDIWNIQDFNDILLSKYTGQDQSVSFNMANALWGDRYTIDRYSDAIKWFQATPDTITSFSDPSAVAVMNGWISANTGGMFNSHLTENTVDNAYMATANALSFKGSLSHCTSPAEMSQEDFHMADGTVRHLTMMHHSGCEWVPHLDEKLFESVNLSISDKSSYSIAPYRLTLIKTKEGVGIGELMDAFCSDNRLLEATMATYIPRKTDIAIPPMEFDCISSLQRTGLKLTGDFMVEGSSCSITSSSNTLMETGINKDRVVLDGYDYVPENPHPEYVSFTMDRPFIFVVWEGVSGLPVFMGAVVNP